MIMFQFSLGNKHVNRAAMSRAIKYFLWLKSIKHRIHPLGSKLNYKLFEVVFLRSICCCLQQVKYSRQMKILEILNLNSNFNFAKPPDTISSCVIIAMLLAPYSPSGSCPYPLWLKHNPQCLAETDFFFGPTFRYLITFINIF